MEIRHYCSFDELAGGFYWIPVHCAISTHFYIMGFLIASFLRTCHTICIPAATVSPGGTYSGIGFLICVHVNPSCTITLSKQSENWIWVSHFHRLGLAVFSCRLILNTRGAVESEHRLVFPSVLLHTSSFAEISFWPHPLSIAPVSQVAEKQQSKVRELAICCMGFFSGAFISKPHCFLSSAVCVSLSQRV